MSQLSTLPVDVKQDYDFAGVNSSSANNAEEGTNNFAQVLEQHLGTKKGGKAAGYGSAKAANVDSGGANSGVSESVKADTNASQQQSTVEVNASATAGTDKNNRVAEDKNHALASADIASEVEQKASAISDNDVSDLAESAATSVEQINLALEQSQQLLSFLKSADSTLVNAINTLNTTTRGDKLEAMGNVTGKAVLAMTERSDTDNLAIDENPVGVSAADHDIGSIEKQAGKANEGAIKLQNEARQTAISATPAFDEDGKDHGEDSVVSTEQLIPTKAKTPSMSEQLVSGSTVQIKAEHGVVSTNAGVIDLENHAIVKELLSKSADPDIAKKFIAADNTPPKEYASPVKPSPVASTGEKLSAAVVIENEALARNDASIRMDSAPASVSEINSISASNMAASNLANSTDAADAGVIDLENHAIVKELLSKSADPDIAKKFMAADNMPPKEYASPVKPSPVASTGEKLSAAVVIENEALARNDASIRMDSAPASVSEVNSISAGIVRASQQMPQHSEHKDRADVNVEGEDAASNSDSEELALSWSAEKVQVKSASPSTVTDKTAAAIAPAPTATNHTLGTSTIDYAALRELNQGSEQPANHATSLYKNAQPVLQTEVIALNRKDFEIAVKEKVLVMIQQKIQQVDIRLDPPELGNMQVRLNLQHEQAVVSFIVQSQQTKEALEQNMPKLKEMLAQQGVDVGGASVEQQSKQSQGDDQRELFSSNQPSASLNEQFDGQTSELGANLVKGSATGIDYYA